MAVSKGRPALPLVRNFFYFHSVFVKISPNNKQAIPWPPIFGVGVPLPWGILNPALVIIVFFNSSCILRLCFYIHICHVFFLSRTNTGIKLHRWLGDTGIHYSILWVVSSTDVRAIKWPLILKSIYKNYKKSNRQNSPLANDNKNAFQ